MACWVCTQESSFLSNKLGICMLGCGCTTTHSLDDDLTIEQFGYNVIASITLFQMKVKMLWVTAGKCMMGARSSKSLSHRYVVYWLPASYCSASAERSSGIGEWVCGMIDGCSALFPSYIYVVTAAPKIFKVERTPSHNGTFAVP